MPTLYAHLPFVSAQSGLVVPSAPLGVDIVAVPYERWRGLDAAFAASSYQERIERKYRASEPVFVVVRDAPDEGAATLAVGSAHLALVLATATRLPSPSYSVSYFRRDDRIVKRTFGPLEREALLYDPDGSRCRLESGVADRLRETSEIVRAAATRLFEPPLHFALRALDQGALAECEPVDDLCLCAIALEELTMRNVFRNLTATFARRVGVLVEPSHARAADGEAVAEAIYRIRSRFLHGEHPLRVCELERISSLARVLLTRGILAASAGLGLLGIANAEGLGDLLEDAASSPALRARLHAMWSP